MPLISQDAERFALCLSIYPLHAFRYVFQPSVTRDAIFLTAIVMVGYRLVTTNSTTASSIIAVSAQNPNLLWTLANFLLISPENTRRHLSSTTPINSELSRWERLKWGVSYALTTRGVGWNWTVPGTPLPIIQSRGSFLCRAGVQFVTWYLALDAMNYYKSTQIFWRYYGMAPGHGSSGAGGLVRNLVNGFVVMAQEYSGLQMAYTALSFVAVLIGIHRPKDFPPMFGSVTEAFTLRRFWGKFWHQNFRDIFSICSKAILGLFPVLPRTNTYHRLQLYTTFAISAVIHVTMVASLPFPNGLPPDKNTPYRYTDQISFFMLQALGIHLEDLLLATIKKTGWTKRWNKMGKVLGFGCLLVWFGYTARFLTDEITIGGVDAENGGMPFKIVEKLMRRFKQDDSGYH